MLYLHRTRGYVLLTRAGDNNFVNDDKGQAQLQTPWNTKRAVGTAECGASE